MTSYEEIRDDMVLEMQSAAPKYPKLKRKKIKDSHLLVVDPADIHLGKLAETFEVGDDVVGELAGERHFELGVFVGEGFEEEALLGLAGNEGRPGSAALEKGFAGVEAESAHGFVERGVVAGLALVDEDGADLALEVVELRDWERAGAVRRNKRRAGTACRAPTFRITLAVPSRRGRGRRLGGSRGRRSGR